MDVYANEEDTFVQPDGNANDPPTDKDTGNAFSPALYLTCGPLLRFTGLVNNTWRGSILIVTDDEQSTYTPIPSLTLSKTTTPVTDLKKLSRTGKPLSLKPATEVQRGIDYSTFHGEGGLFRPDSQPQPQSQPEHLLDPTQLNEDSEDEEDMFKVDAVQIHTERGVTFWRFDLCIPQDTDAMQISYRINRSPCAQHFWIPAVMENMHVMFHSCNGFSLGVDTGLFSGPDPLWRDVLRKHTSPSNPGDKDPSRNTNNKNNGRPFHLMLGGGDQLYTDESRLSSPNFSRWTETTSLAKLRSQFTNTMRDELESFFLQRYTWWFSQGLYSVAAAHIPSVNIWDDHDIIDGYGSYPHRTMESDVFKGLGGVAWRYYMLFQHHVSPGAAARGVGGGSGSGGGDTAETGGNDGSWILGRSTGPYIAQVSRSVFVRLGPGVVFLGLDCRTERTRSRIVYRETYNVMFERLRREITSDTKHLLILLGVPIIYPRLSILEALFSSRLMTPLKALGRTGLLSPALFNKFDGSVEILDDLDDHWTTRHHRTERQFLLEALQKLAVEKNIRVTFLSGDVHLGAVGEFFTPSSSERKHRVRFWKRRDEPSPHKEGDGRYMACVISSAITNRPPAGKVADILNRVDRGRTHYVGGRTGEKMVGVFGEDVDGRARRNRHLLPRRNYCEIGDGGGVGSGVEDGVVDGTGEKEKATGEGLDVQLHFEMDTGDPAGWTKGYNLRISEFRGNG